MHFICKTGECFSVFDCPILWDIAPILILSASKRIFFALRYSYCGAVGISQKRSECVL